MTGPAMMVIIAGTLIESGNRLVISCMTGPAMANQWQSGFIFTMKIIIYGTLILPDIRPVIGCNDWASNEKSLANQCHVRTWAIFFPDDIFIKLTSKQIKLSILCLFWGEGVGSQPTPCLAPIHIGESLQKST